MQTGYTYHFIRYLVFLFVCYVLLPLLSCQSISGDSFNTTAPSTSTYSLTGVSNSPSSTGVLFSSSSDVVSPIASSISSTSPPVLDSSTTVVTSSATNIIPSTPSSTAISLPSTQSSTSSLLPSSTSFPASSTAALSSTSFPIISSSAASISPSISSVSPSSSAVFTSSSLTSTGTHSNNTDTGAYVEPIISSPLDPKQTPNTEYDGGTVTGSSNIPVWAISLIVIVCVLLAALLLMRLHTPVAKHSALYTFLLAFGSLFVKVWFLLALYQKSWLSSVFYTALVLLILTMIIGLFMIFYLVREEALDHPSFRLWLYDRAFSFTTIAMISSCNLDALAVIQSNICHLTIFSAPISLHFLIRLRIYGIFTIVFLDIPYVIIQLYVAANVDRFTTVTIIGLVISACVITFGIIKRIFICLASGHCGFGTDEQTKKWEQNHRNSINHNGFTTINPQIQQQQQAAQIMNSPTERSLVKTLSKHNSAPKLKSYMLTTSTMRPSHMVNSDVVLNINDIQLINNTQLNNDTQAPPSYDSLVPPNSSTNKCNDGLVVPFDSSSLLSVHSSSPSQLLNISYSSPSTPATTPAAVDPVFSAKSKSFESPVIGNTMNSPVVIHE